MTQTHTITVEPLGVEVSCRRTSTILEACLRQGVNVPHACTHGTCATCKVEILDGDVDLGEASAFALLDSERTEGKALICTAAQDRRDDRGRHRGGRRCAFHPVRDFTGTVTLLEECAHEIRRVELRLWTATSSSTPASTSRSHSRHSVTRSWSWPTPPGQSRRVELRSSAPRRPGHRRLGVREPGRRETPSQVSGPFGRFFLREARNEPAILIGGGRLAPAEGDGPPRAGDRLAAAAAPVSRGPDSGRPLRPGVLPGPGEALPGPVQLPSGPVPRTGRGHPHRKRDRRRRCRLRDLPDHVAYLCGPPAMVEPR